MLNFVASPNLTTSRAAVFAARRGLEFCRTVPGIVFALMFVVAFGLGPLAGVLAIAIHTAGALGKQFFETTENIDMKPVEGLRASGANWAQTVRFAAVPQVLASFASFALLRFEINVREATVLGFVGAGGIGQDLMEAIRKFYYSDVSAILVLIIAVVVAIDVSTQYLRHALLGEGRGRMSALAVADLAALKARHPDAFRPRWGRRALDRRRAGAAGGDLCLCALSISISPGAASLPGLRQIVWFLEDDGPARPARTSLHLSERARRDARHRLARHAARARCSRCRSACWRRATSCARGCCARR